MALKEEYIRNCDNEESQDVPITRIIEDNALTSFSPTLLDQPTENLIYSDWSLREKHAGQKDPCASLTKLENCEEVQDWKGVIPNESNVEAQHDLTHQRETKKSLSFISQIKNEECSLCEESGVLSQPSNTTFVLTETSSIGSYSTIKCGPGMKIKIDNDYTCLASSSSTDDASPSAPSKRKLRNTKRREGILYKQLTSSKLSKATSKYFSHIHTHNDKRWIPPRSPYALVQEDLFDNPWQLLVATIFLTKTTAKKALPQLHKFLARYPRPEDVLKASYGDIDEYFKPLGLTTTRSHIIMRFTVEFLEKDWTYPRELYGIGKYGDDSYRMFCINEWRQVSPDDIPLTMYRNWLLENAERLGVG